MRQLPEGEEQFLDHIAHFVEDLDSARTILERAGFELTPFTRQQNRTPDGMVPTGMANQCVMLRQGYVELLTSVSPSPLSTQFTAAVNRYTGIHLVAFSTDQPDVAFSRLERSGFQPSEQVSLTRPVEDASGAVHEARFTVMRVAPDTMPEGRIQILQHHTPQVVWQDRWMGHTNGLETLEGVLICVHDPDEAAERFGRFTGVKAERRHKCSMLQLDRGACVFMAPDDLATATPFAGTETPDSAMPQIVASCLGSSDIHLTDRCFAKAGIERRAKDVNEASYAFPSCIGGFATVVPTGLRPDWLS